MLIESKDLRLIILKSPTVDLVVSAHSTFNRCVHPKILISPGAQQARGISVVENRTVVTCSP